ncbi:hypothetical protein NQ176_g3747 [Zarea fungicola]|uniref:Uncharacterized protein n=1 Tax=Zarea fungicola TaxID=93591 RepID=A0ACC1NHN1_9HYPO|nr:hypothetical protein NQ176_g3747 [Lecanicillium fungicola]
MVEYIYPIHPAVLQSSSGSDKENNAISHIRGFAFERGDPMDVAKESTQPLQELGRVVASQSLYQATSAELKMQLMKDLARTSDSVFTLSSDGKTYLAPDALRGVPVKRINEASGYWQEDWTSLKTLLAAQTEAHLKKLEYRQHADALGIRRTDRKNMWRQKEKVASDDCSKYAKIREVFGNGHGKYHPNQIVAKHYLPASGLCEKELLYKMALKISNLCDLHKMNKLAMDPYDFYRWAVCRNLDASLEYKLSSSKATLKSIIRSMGDESGTRRSTDEGFRTLVLYWASLTNNEKKFRKPGSKRVRSRSSNSGISTSLGGAKSASRQAAMEMKRRLELQPRQRKKQTAAAVQGVGYTGVNALRAMQRLTITNVE